MALILRTCRKDGKSHNNFQWNLEIDGVTTAPDWKPTQKCGNGLHGFLNGEGDGYLADWSDKAIWLVVEPIGEIIDLKEAVKFESATTKFVGDLENATKYLREQIGDRYAVIGSTVTVGYGQTAVVGYKGTAKAGDFGTAKAGDFGTAKAGDFGTAKAADRGIATVGLRGTATVGHHGTATAGNYGTANAGYCGTASAGENGTIVIKYWCTNKCKYKLKVGYIGENGLKPNTLYRLCENNEFTARQLPTTERSTATVLE